jgi:hypothetical protein
MGPGSSMVEAVLSVDLTTGIKEDVHDKFGFEIVTNPLVTRPTNSKIDGPERVAIEREEYDLSLLRGRSDREKEYNRRYARLAQARKVLKGEVKSANYRYAPGYEDKYVTVTDDKGYSYEMIKLSDVIQIAIEKRTINPKTDFVIVQACRTFDGQLPPDYDGSKSPGRDESAAKRSRSAGGRKRMRGTLGSLLTKNRNNRNRNNRNKNNTKKRKRKTKTIWRK